MRIIRHSSATVVKLANTRDLKSLRAGDLVKVNTRRSETLATCLCDSFTVDVTDKEKIKNVFNAFGVDEPTAYVIGKFTYDEWK